MKTLFAFLSTFLVAVGLFAQPLTRGTQIALQADTKKWVARCNNCQKAADPGRLSNTATIHVEWVASSLPGYARFTVEDMDNGKVALKADNGFYLARCQGCIPGGPANAIAIHVQNPSPAFAQYAK